MSTIVKSDPQQAHLKAIIRDVQRMAGVHRPPPSGAGVPALVIGVTSPQLGDGKTTVAMAIANSLAHDFEGGATLVDADFATHSIAEEYRLGPVPGLVDVLTGDAASCDVTHALPESPLRVVSAGLGLDRSPRAIRSGARGLHFRELGAGTSFVVVDLPATLPTDSAPLIAAHCDAVIVVARSGRTSRRELALTLSKLTEVNVIGVVLNRWRSRIPRFVERLLGVER